MPTVQPYSATAQVKSLAGTAALPGITFTGDTDTGFYSPAANQVAITTGGVQRLLIGSDGSITPSGSLLFPAGTASAPSLSFAGDTNTGIYSPGADQVAISTGGTGRLFVDANGNVGINRVAPQAYTGYKTLEIEDTTGAVIRLRNTSGSAVFEMAANASEVYLSNTLVSPLTFKTSNTERLRITSAGLVGVGTSSPGTTLEISSGGGSVPNLNGTSGNLAITQPGLLTSLQIGGYDTAPYALWLQGQNKSGSTFPIVLNPAGGNVGVGTSSPSHKLDVQGGVISAGNGTIYGGISYSTRPEIGAISNHDCGFITNNTTRMLLDTSGRLGIGTTSPTRTLDVNGSIQLPSNNALYINGSNNYLYADSTATELASATLIKFVTNGSERLRITSAGLVGIGASAPQAKLEVVGGTNAIYSLRDTGNGGLSIADFGGGVAFGTSSGGSAAYIGGSIQIRADQTWTAGSSHPSNLIFSIAASGSTTPTERLRITSAGLVGIGTTTPQSLLNISTAATPGDQNVLICGTASSGINGSHALYLGAYGSTQYGCKIKAIYNYAGSVGTALSFEVSNNAGTLIEAARIDSSGRLGIGTTSPSTTLSIGASASSSFNGGVCLNRGPSVYNFYEASDGTNTVIFGLDHTLAAAKIGSVNSYPIGFFTGNTERLRITAAGLVGVGTSSPSFTAHVSGAKNTTQLFVAAPTISAVNDFTQIGFGLSNTEFGLIRLGFDNPSAITNSYFSFFNNTGSGLQESLRIDSSGRVGIGTSSPSYSLDVSGIIQAGNGFLISQNGGSAVRVGAAGQPDFNNPGSDLYFSVTAGQKFAWGNSANRTDMTLDSSGRLGIGTTSPQYPLDVTGTGNSGILGDGSIRAYSANRTAYLSVAYNGFDVSTNSGGMLFTVNQSEAARIDSSKRLLVGTSTNNTTFNSRLQVKSDNTTASAIVIDHYENDTSGGIVFLAKSRSATVGTMTVVQNGDTLGEVQFWGADGTQHRQGASIKTQVDGTPGANDMPGRLVFSTTADGASSPTERLRIDSAGQIEAGSLGTAAAPVWTFLSDTNTGIYSPGADQVAISTNGAGRLFVDASGNVGLNTSSPGFFFDVNTGAANEVAAGFRTNATGSAISFRDSTTTSTARPQVGAIGNDFVVKAGNTPTERLRITSAGLVGIGTSSPTHALSVVDATAYRGISISGNNAPNVNFANGTAEWKVGISGTVGTSFSISKGASNDDKFSIDSSGRVGIGTTSPGDVLDTAAGNYRGITIKCGTTTNRPTLSFFNTADSLAAYIQAIGSSLAFGRMGTDYGGHTETARLDSSGRLGIGTSSPSYLLDVASSVAQVGNSTDAFIQYKSTAGNWHVGANSSNAYVFYAGTYGSGTERARIDSSGRLLVGTSSTSAAARVLVSGGDGARGVLNIASTSATPADGDDLGFISFNDSSHIYNNALIRAQRDGGTWTATTSKPTRLTFSTTADGASSPTERMRITSSGNVGIGTASPNSRLAVNGSITESTDGGTTYHNVVTAQDIGTDPNQVPLNQFLGQLAFMDEVGDVPTASAPPQDNLSVNFEYVSNTSIKIRMRGTDGVVRSVTLTLS